MNIRGRSAINPEFSCIECQAPFAPPEILEHSSRHWQQLDTVEFECPSCAARDTLQIWPNAIRRGYVYAAGSAHFAVVTEFSVPGLLRWRSADALEVELDGQTWQFRSEPVGR